MFFDFGFFDAAKFSSVAHKDFYAVVFGRIVTCGNHNAEVAPHFPRKVSNGVGGQDSYVDNVTAVVVHAFCKRPHKLLPGRTRIPAHDYDGRVSVRSAQRRPQKISAPAVQFRAEHSPDTVRSENIIHHDLRNWLIK